jgi:hypothetical protein
MTMTIQTQVSSNGAATEATPALPAMIGGNPVAVTDKFRYLEGQPKQYRADAKAGNFNVNGGNPTMDSLSFIPMAWRFFEDDILQMGRKKWVEIFFVDEKNCVSAILFHGYSRDNLEKLARDLFYEDVTLSDVKIMARFVPRKNEKQKPAIVYHIARFEVDEVADPETVKDLHDFAESHKIFRVETLSDTCHLEAYHHFHLPALVPDREPGEAAA